MTQKCSECSAPTVWDDDAASQICTTCGTLADASQSHFPSNVDDHGFYNLPSTLKSFRLGSNWDLAGQGTEARDRKNRYAMAEFINSLAVSLNASALSPRTINLFNQAKSVAQFRWGRKSKLVAGACLAIALRESHRSDSLHDIAFLLSEQFSTLVRTLFSVTSLLHLSPTPSDPTIHISDLFNFLSSLILADCHSELPSALPSALLTQIKPLSLRAAANTATSLSKLIARLGPDHSINLLPSPPTACALFLLALEAQFRAPLSNIGDLAQSLGTSCHVGRGVIMERYKLIQDEIIKWIERVPWLGKYERSQGKRKNRAKVGKRTVVARGLADVLQFQDEIWRGQLKPSVILDVIDDDDDDDDGTLSDSESLTTTASTCTPSELLLTHSNKRRRITDYSFSESTQFLLHPLSAPIPLPGPTLTPAPTTSPLPESCLSQPSFSPSKPISAHPHPPPSLAFASYILTVPSLPDLLSTPNIHLPTRLQILVAERGGAGDDVIKDDELFLEGELEGLFRGDEEAEQLRVQFIESGIWDEHELEPANENEVAQGRKGRRKRGSEGKRSGNLDGEGIHERGRGARINLEALARFLRDPASLESTNDDEDSDAYGAMLLGPERLNGDEEDEEDGYYGIENDKAEHDDYGGGSRSSLNQEKGEVIIDEWRPLSPVVALSPNVGTYEEGHG